MADRRAVDWLLADHSGERSWADVTPVGCSDCPFARLAWWLGAPDALNADMGAYLCELLDGRTVWGEQPACSEPQWKQRAREEIAEPRSRRPARTRLRTQLGVPFVTSIDALVS